MTGIVLAFDKSEFEGADRALLIQVAPFVEMVKVGLEAYNAKMPGGYITVGSAAHLFVERLRGGRGFKDLKLHDIGTTMAKAMKNISGTTEALTVHASSSFDALKAVVTARNEQHALFEGRRTLLIGVTILTDITAEECEYTYGSPPETMVPKFAEKLIETGFDGIVCSGHELKALERQGLTKDLLTLVPGTRPSWAPADDQKRVMTYEEVAELGATWTVVGRVVMNASDPVEALAKVRAELDGH